MSELDLDAIEALYDQWPDVTTPMLVSYYRQIPALVAELREHRAAQEARSKKAMWETVRVLELEEDAVGLKADLAEANGRLDEMGAR